MAQPLPLPIPGSMGKRGSMAEGTAIHRGAPQVGKHGRIGHLQHLEAAHPEYRHLLAHLQHAADPVQERGRIAHLGFNVHPLVAVDGVHRGGQEELGEIGAGEAAVAVRGPLHGRTHRVAVPQIDVVAHTDLIPVIEHW